MHFATTIQAPVAVVWHHMTTPGSYERWASAFSDGSRFEGSWETGSKILFLSPSGDGMVSEIAESRRHECISIRHRGFRMQGVEDTTSEAVLAWAPAYETYTFRPAPDGTELVIDQDAPVEWEEHLAGSWPKALQLLKTMCESADASTPVVRS